MSFAHYGQSLKTTRKDMLKIQISPAIFEREKKQPPVWDHIKTTPYSQKLSNLMLPIRLWWKCIANRLKKFLSSIILESQSAFFLPIHLIIDKNIIAYGLIRVFRLPTPVSKRIQGLLSSHFGGAVQQRRKGSAAWECLCSSKFAGVTGLTWS